MHNDIRECAKAYKELMNCEFIFVVGKRGRETKLILKFEREQFSHLLGLDKLTDIKDLIRCNKKSIFDDIINSNDKLKSIIENSTQYYQHTNVKRRESFCNLYELLMSENLIFKNNKECEKKTKIPFDFLIKGIKDKNIISLFVRKENNSSEEYIGISQFIVEKDDISSSATGYTLLYKAYINKQNKTHSVLFCHKNFSYEKMINSN